MRKKAWGLFCVLAAFFGAAAYSIATVSGGAEYVAAARGQSVYELDVAQARGMIYDRDLRPLVGETKKTVAAVAPTIEAVGALETATGGKNRERLAGALEDGKPFVMELSPEEAAQVEDQPCIDLFTVAQRYSDDQLAPHVVGYVDGLGGGVSGVELAMDDVLEGFAGEAAVFYQVDALGRVLPGGDRQVADSLGDAKGGVALTLDKEIQTLAQTAGQALGKGAVVVTEVPNCEIRALASFPTYPPNDLGAAAEDEDGPLVNRAFSAYAPGSVFKLCTAAAALESGAPLEKYECVGSVNAGGMMFHCIDGKAHGEVGIREALEKSCNCYFISCGRSLGGQNVLSMAYNLGLGEGQEFGRGLFSQAGDLPTAASLENTRALANFSFGQGELTVTPLQMCGLLNAVASGGVYSSPKLILGTVDGEKSLSPVRPVTDKTVRVMGAATAHTLWECMEGAAKNGTGRSGAPDNCGAGIKTGTAQTGVFRDGEELLNFWYCGFVRDEAGPRYCITVLAEGTPDDRGAAARVFREVAEGLGETMAK